jgi:ribosomal protein L37AE/L43A
MFVTCPNCGTKSSANSDVCSNCQFDFRPKPAPKPVSRKQKPLNNEVFIDPINNARFTKTRLASPSAGARAGNIALAGAGGFILGGGLTIIGLILVLIVPFFGLFCGGILIIFGIMAIIMGVATGAAVITAVEGHCPYCGVVNKYNITSMEQTVRGNLNCSSCRENILYRNDNFYQDFLSKRTR